MRCVDRYGLPLTGGVEAVAAYNRGVGNLLRLEEGGLASVAASVVLDPTFALGHAALALLGHELCAPVDLEARIRDARVHARRSTERERSHVHAIVQHVRGDSAPLVSHLEQYPRDALLLSTAVPTIAFSASGASSTRSAPNSSMNPSVTLNAPPKAPMSWPRQKTVSSRRISVRSPSEIASR